MRPDPRLTGLVACLFLAGALLIGLAHHRQAPGADRRRRDWLKYGVYAAVINGLWGAAYLGRTAAGAALGLIALGGTAEIFRLVRPPYRAPAAVTAGLALAVALRGMLWSPGTAGEGAFAFVVLVTAATDSFAELTGRLCGGRRLCPRLSPHKTVAGLLGGLGMAVLVALLLGFLLPGAHGVGLALLGLTTGLGAVGGDLLCSAIKRAAGVKDFSDLLPGHGGVLDRFDSLLLAAPLFHWSRAVLGG